MPWIAKDRIGMQFGSWTIKERDLSKKRPTRYICICSCGEEHSLLFENIRRGASTQCMKCSALSRSEHMVGNKYFHLTVLSNEKIKGKAKLKCLCDCGNIKYFSAGDIKDDTSHYTTCGECDLFKKAKFRTKIGTKIGLLTIHSKIDQNTYLAKCDCGNEKAVKSHHMQVKVPSCGCYWRKIKEEKAKKNIGLKWGRLKVIEFIGMKGEKSKTRAHYLIKCKCGNLIEKEVGDMFAISSCGCLQKDSVVKGSQNHLAKTNEIEVETIRKLFQSGHYTRKELSEMIGVTYVHLCQLLKKISWKHVK